MEKLLPNVVGDLHMAVNKVRLILLSSSMLIILIVLGFTSFINIISFQQSHHESLAANYKVLAGQMVRKIEYAIKYGKPLTNFYGIENILNPSFPKVDFLKHAQVVLPSGEIIYNENGFVEGKVIPEHLKEKVNFFNTSEDVIYGFDEENYYIFSPIHDENGRWIASLNLVFDDQLVSSETNQFVIKTIYIFCGFFALFLMMLYLFLKKIPFVSEANQLFKKRVLLILVLIMSTVQIANGIVNYFHLKDGYLDLVTKNTSLTLNVIKSEIEGVLSKGVLYEDLYGLGDYMNGMIETVNEISRISVINVDFSTEGILDVSTNTKYSYSTPLMNDVLSERQYVAVVDLSKEYIDKRMQQYLLDLLTNIVISILLIFEFLQFVTFLLEERMKKNEQSVIGEKREMNRVYILPVSFVTFTGVCLTYAYIPILMKQFISKTDHSFLVIGIPLFAELLFIILSFFLAIRICNRTGWRNLFIFGAMVIMIGSFASAISWNSTIFVIARSIAGLGVGFIIVSFYRFSFYYKFSLATKKQNFPLFQSGAIGGMFLGIIGGAMLAERIGLFAVYYVMIPFLLLSMVFALKLMPNYVEKRYVRRRMYFYSLEKRKKFMKNRHVYFFILFIMIPASLVNIFFYYLMPMMAYDFNFSIANIGLLFLIQWLLYVLFVPFYENQIAKFIRPGSMIFISFLAAVFAFGLYGLQSKWSFFIFMVILLGASHSAGSVARQLFFREMEIVSLLDEDEKVGYYYIFAFVSNIIGLILIAIIFQLFEAMMSFVFFSALMFVSAMWVLFMSYYRRKKRSEAAA